MSAFLIPITFLLSSSSTSPLNFFIMIGGIFKDSSRGKRKGVSGAASVLSTTIFFRKTGEMFNFRVARLCVIDRRSKINKWVEANSTNYFCRIHSSKRAVFENCRSSDFNAVFCKLKNECLVIFPDKRVRSALCWANDQECKASIMRIINKYCESQFVVNTCSILSSQ